MIVLAIGHDEDYGQSDRESGCPIQHGYCTWPPQVCSERLPDDVQAKCDELGQLAAACATAAPAVDGQVSVFLLCNTLACTWENDNQL